MSYIIKEKSNFKPCPVGIHKAVCVDVVLMKDVETNWGTKNMIRLVWETTAAMEDGRPFIINERYTESLNLKSNLRKRLKSWRGRDLTSEELAGFDIEKLIGVSCQIVVVHNENAEGKVFANVDSIIKSEVNLKPSGTYVRVKDRPKTEEKIPNKKEDDLKY